MPHDRVKIDNAARSAERVTADAPDVVPSARDDDDVRLSTLLNGLAGVLSLTLHAGVAVAALVWFEPKAGAVAVTSEAITIELIASEVVEAAHSAPVSEDSAAGHTPDVQSGSEREAPAREPAEQPASSRDQPEAREAAVTPPEPSPATSDHARMPVVPDGDEQPAQSQSEPAQPQPRGMREDDAPAEMATPPTKIVKSEPKQPAAHKKSATSRKGGVPSRAMQALKPNAARASASTGSAFNYAAEVRARVASRRPSGQGQRGTVLITFGVSPHGGLTFANISRSSGDPSLDRRVLAAVRSAAPFPAPPAGASPRQRQFSMPFHFQ